MWAEVQGRSVGGDVISVPGLKPRAFGAWERQEAVDPLAMLPRDYEHESWSAGGM
jgi:hypothetical protein